MSNILNSWRKSLLDDLVPGISKLTLVFDQDSLLKDELLVRELFNRGFQLIELEDTIEFRYIFESRYRKICPFSILLTHRPEMNIRYEQPHLYIRIGTV